MSLPKYRQVAASIRAQIADGLLLPGEPAPSGAALSRATGYSTLTCRKALTTLIKDGVLVPGASPTARPRVPSRAPTRAQQTIASAGRALSAALAARRRAAGLTQPQFADIADTSVTSVGHAETGRLWQSRDFWERADKALSAGGKLLALHDAYRAAVPADPAITAEETATETAADTPPTLAVGVSAPVTCVTITWADGEVTTIYPPESPARPAAATPAYCPRG
jgi:DNA-binding transcriptional regulator YhcF (GntR family)